MSESWDPWRIAGNEQAIAPPPVVAPSLFRQADGPYLARQQQSTENNNDFISVLALAQNLEFDFLPITWHPAIQTVGAGATAEIRQALVNIQASFAFKRTTLSRDDALRALSSEISVLGNPVGRHHENIITLEGICWDINPDGPVIWPVLVFKKAHYGNLEEFIQSERGRALSTPQKLSLLGDIARGLACLHMCGKSFHPLCCETQADR
jgi:hypothetical protein